MNTLSRSVLTLKRAPEEITTPTLEERLQKVLATAGLGSRRLLESRIDAGEIKVNGEIAKIGWNVHSGDRVELDGKLFVAIQTSSQNAEVLAYHKPEGVVTTRDDPEGRPTVFEQLPRLKGARWIAVGRLDLNTTGLLLLTTDGALANALMHPRGEIEREYICRIHGEVSDDMLEKLRAGVELEDGNAHFNELAVISRGPSHSWFRVILTEGRNREVRRLWESQGLMVSRLKRIRYGTIELPRGLKKGHCEPLDNAQIKNLRKLCGTEELALSLTLQPVIGQRRAKSGQEFRPEPRSQQAWTSERTNESQELRRFDRLREDRPLTPSRHRQKYSRDSWPPKTSSDRKKQFSRKEENSQASGKFRPRNWFAEESASTLPRTDKGRNSRNPDVRGVIHQNANPFHDQEKFRGKNPRHQKGFKSRHSQNTDLPYERSSEKRPSSFNRTREDTREVGRGGIASANNKHGHFKGFAEQKTFRKESGARHERQFDRDRAADLKKKSPTNPAKGRRASNRKPFVS